MSPPSSKPTLGQIGASARAVVENALHAIDARTWGRASGDGDEDALAAYANRRDEAHLTHCARILEQERELARLAEVASRRGKAGH